MNKVDVSHIHWLGHASFRIDVDPITIYIDPWQLGEDPKLADLILITHDHRDHCSPEDIDKIQKEDTIVVTVKEAAKNLKGDIQIIQPWEELNIKGVKIRAVPAYNVSKFRSPGVPFHPKENGYVGFVISLEGQRIYHAGDTDLIPEMAEIESNIAMLPVSGTYVMTSDEALEAAKILNTDLIIPMHVGRGIGTGVDLDNFMHNCSVPVVVMDLEE